MYNNWASDPEVSKFLTWPYHETVETSRKITDNWVDSYEKDDYYQWMIVLKEIDEPIGSIMASTVGRAQSAHIGYCIGKRWWHQGIMTETLTAVMDFLFDEVGYHRVEAMHDSNNPHSGDVMKKCGMKYEGTLRQADRNNQGICDACYYGLLASER
jgi:ribosomal-protein-alanine N-acetyltransferase